MKRRHDITQCDLFGTAAVTIPSRAELARQARDAGIAQASAHADAVLSRWTDRAYLYFCEYAKRNYEFIMESAREHAEREGFPAPPDKRAWGAIAMRAARQGVVESIGYGIALSSHCSPKALWRSRIYR